MSKYNDQSEILLQKARLACGDFDRDALEFLEAMYADPVETGSDDEHHLETENTSLKDAQKALALDLVQHASKYEEISERIKKIQECIEEIMEAFLDDTLEPGNVSRYRKVGDAVSVWVGMQWHDFSLFNEVSDTCSGSMKREIDLKKSHCSENKARNVWYIPTLLEQDGCINALISSWPSTMCCFGSSNDAMRPLKASTISYSEFSPIDESYKMSKLRKSDIETRGLDQCSPECCAKSH